MKSSRKLIVGKLREAEESNRRKSRIITQFEREQKESKVRIEIDVKTAGALRMGSKGSRERMLLSFTHSISQVSFSIPICLFCQNNQESLKRAMKSKEK